MPFTIGLDIAGVKQVHRALMVKSEAVKDLRPVWDDIYKDFLKREKLVFQRQGNVGSRTREVTGAKKGGSWGKWEPLDKAYAARKRAAGFGSKILVRTGDLRDSLTQRGHSEAVFNPSKRWLTMGTTVPYAGYHQTGTGRSGGRSGSTITRMPAREPIRISEAQARFWVRLVNKFLHESGQFERAN